MSDVKITHTLNSADAAPPSPARDRELEAIRTRAYELFLERGDAGGNEMDDWFAAEREILGAESGIVAERDEAYDVDVSLPGFAANDVEITATDHEVVVHALKSLTRSGREGNTMRTESAASEVYRRFRLPTPVRAEAISADLRDGILHVHAPKSRPMSRTELLPARRHTTRAGAHGRRAPARISSARQRE